MRVRVELALLVNQVTWADQVVKIMEARLILACQTRLGEVTHIVVVVDCSAPEAD